jgi:hypothetical protein
MFVVYWTEYTATVNGRVLKLVPCEYCGPSTCTCSSGMAPG